MNNYKIKKDKDDKNIDIFFNGQYRDIVDREKNQYKIKKSVVYTPQTDSVEIVYSANAPKKLLPDLNKKKAMRAMSHNVEMS